MDIGFQMHRCVPWIVQLGSMHSDCTIGDRIVCVNNYVDFYRLGVWNRFLFLQNNIFINATTRTSFILSFGQRNPLRGTLKNLLNIFSIWSRTNDLHSNHFSVTGTLDERILRKFFGIYRSHKKSFEIFHFFSQLSTDFYKTTFNYSNWDKYATLFDGKFRYM